MRRSQFVKRIMRGMVIGQKTLEEVQRLQMHKGITACVRKEKSDLLDFISLFRLLFRKLGQHKYF